MEPLQLSLFKRNKNLMEEIKLLFNQLNLLPLKEKISTINEIRKLLHEYSPFKSEPVDCVIWIPIENVQANDYNPNSVAPPEMELLRHSIKEDGYTQPIVAWTNEDGVNEVVDGFHRNRVAREFDEVGKRVHGHLPLALINNDRENRCDRIASTIRHNRARGKHRVSSMSEIVLELKNRNWTDDRISRELGMDKDEILRLCQITGLAGLFSDQEFSKSWDIEDSEPEFIPLTEEFELGEDDNFRTVNTNDSTRIFHTHDKWECYKAGLYATTMEGMTKTQCENLYYEFLSDLDRFDEALKHVITEWKYSCEHYLTNSSMNRIAWLGQAAMCYATGVPGTFRGGFNLLSTQQQYEANQKALFYLNEWLKANGRENVDLMTALSNNQMDLY